MMPYLRDSLKFISIQFYIIFLLFVSNGIASDKKAISFKEYVKTNYTTKDGLPSNEVYCVFQDSKGFVWMGTDRGVARFDGYDFKVYTSEEGLTDNTIFGITEDSKGQVWFTTSNKTLSYFGLDGNMHSFKHNRKILSGLDHNEFNRDIYFDQIYIDSNDIIYLANHQWGYIEIPINQPNEIVNHTFNVRDIRNLKVEIEIIQENKYQNIFGTTCALGNSGEVNLNINKKYKTEISLEKLRHLERRPYLLNDSVFTIGNHICTINETGVKDIKIPFNVHVFKIGDQYLINKIKSKNKGKVYLVKDINVLSEEQMLLNKPIRLTCAIKDKNQGIWLSSLEQGVFYFPNMNNRIIKKDINVASLLPYDSGLLFAERNENFGIYYKNSEVKYFADKPTLKSLPYYCQHSIKLSHALEFKEINEWFNKERPESGRLISNICLNNDVILLSKKNSFIQYDIDKGRNKTIVFKHNIHSLEKKDSDHIFIGCEDGIYLINTDENLEGNIIRPHTENKPYLKIETKPRDLKWFKKRNILAIATIGNGILFYKNNKFYRKITIKDGLVSNSINQLFLDKEERLWVGTNRGINYIEIDNKDSIIVNNFMASSRNLLSPNIQQMFILEDSLLYIGTDKGLNEVVLNFNKSSNNYYFPIFITNIKVNKKKSFVSDLNYKENNIEFEFTAIEFNKYGGINYRYRLNEVSKDWIYTKDRKATFLQLTSGKYTFELEAQNESGNWIPLDKPVIFNINMPYWETWWFRGIMIILFFMVVGGALYYYILNLKKEKSLTEDKQLLSEELNESRQKALSAQLNPHFVFNSLNSIQNFILTKRTELSSDYLGMFSKLMRFVFENSKKLYVPLSDEIEALRLYLELEQVRHNHKFVCYIKQDKDINIDQVFIPSLLVQPLIENAIWHGLLHKLSGERILEVEFTSDKDNLHIIVKDNGVGRGKVNPRPKLIRKQKSSGVELTKQRLDLLSQSTGLKTNFEVIDLIDNNQKPCGTMVKISIPIQLS